MATGSSMSEELKRLILHRQQIKGWLADTNSRIAELEEQYLEETPYGNIIRGFEYDGRLLPLRSRGNDEKEKMFSNSSYQYWLSKTLQENEFNERKGNSKVTAQAVLVEQAAPPAKPAGIKQKKQKRKESSGSTKRDSLTNSFIDDWDIMDDF